MREEGTKARRRGFTSREKERCGLSDILEEKERNDY